MKNNDRSSIFRLKRRRFLGGIGTLSDTRFCCDCIRVLYITHPSTVFGIQVSNTHQNAPFVIHVNIYRSIISDLSTSQSMLPKIVQKITPTKIRVFTAASNVYNVIHLCHLGHLPFHACFLQAESHLG